jgi:hypothetical protein
MTIIADTPTDDRLTHWPISVVAATMCEVAGTHRIIWAVIGFAKRVIGLVAVSRGKSAMENELGWLEQPIRSTASPNNGERER